MSWPEFIAELTPGLVAGLLLAVAGAAAAILFQRWHEHRSTLEQGRFRVYMMLLELNGIHFWITSSEVHGETSRPETLASFQRLRWRIADELRKLDRLPDLEAILRTMFSLHYASERERAEALVNVLDELGRDVNPRYKTAMAEITKNNQTLMATNMEEFMRRQKKIDSL